MNIKISVVIPTYNAAAFIKIALNSVLNQNYAADEVIVVDDGSVDDIETVITPYLEKISFFKKNNSGAADTRNFGVKKAKNKWVAFLDADDIWHKDKLAYQAKALTESVAIVCCQYKFVSEVCQSSLDHVKPTDLSVELSNSELLDSPYLATPTIIVNKDMFDDIGGYNEGLKTAEDLDLYLRLMLKGEVIQLGSELVHCLISPNSLTTVHDTYENEISLYHSLLKEAAFAKNNADLQLHIEKCRLKKLTFLVFKRRLDDFFEYRKQHNSMLPISKVWRLWLKAIILKYLPV